MNEIFRYCIDYTPAIRGGIGNPVIMTLFNRTLIFENESEMLKKLAELKADICVTNIEVSIVELKVVDRRKYEI